MSKVTAKYQITIPPEVRKELGILPGTNVDIAKENDKYVLIASPIAELKRKWRGRLKGGKSSDEYINEIRGKLD